ncbi:putative heat shock protein 70-like protein [Rosellinia necatrix]|uniref:Putative heat shock protein 70-like protein n=1 Tax=Rosellinia necatrix TaxID=77044 RepID=A0A1W2TL16_ROSNE|nr:putative heat shock protein 70-like protein [Rosellinia necatrix]
MAPTFSLRSIFLSFLFLFSSNVLAISAVLGVDLGTEYIKASLVKPGIPLEIVLTKDSRRKETAAVAFKPSQHALESGSYPERSYGSDAIALAARFPGDVYPNLKTLLGLPLDHSIAQEYAAKHPSLQIEAVKDRDTIAFKSKATAEEEAWMVEELLAMELQSIQRNAEALAGPGSAVRSVVITVPTFYTTDEKRAVELACELVGLKVLSLISDGLAVGLNYATSRTFPTVNEGGKPEYHMVFDMGAGSTKATIMKFQGRTVKDVGKFNKTVQEVQVLGSGWDRTLGGDAFNYLLVDDMVSKFVETSGAKKASVTAEGVRGHGRAMAKMLKEAERLRHILSANVEAAGGFEALYEDVDFRYKVSRADFEKLAESHAARVSAAARKALDIAELDITQLDSIILHGGASRTPFVQKQLEKLAGDDKLRSNVNSDEAAVFGAGFRAAELSPSFRVKEIRVSDGAAYAAGMKWTSPQNKPQQQRLWTERSLLSAAPKEVTFTNHEDFAIRFFQQIPSPDGLVERETTELKTSNLTATVASLVVNHGCTEEDIQFKVQLRLSPENGEVRAVKAFAECETEEVEKEGIMDGVKNLFGFGKNKDQKPLADGEESSESETTSAGTSASSSTESTASPSSSESAESVETIKKRLVVIPVDYSTEKLGTPGLSKADMTKAKDRLKAFETSDKARRLREETLNQLEGFTYKIRDLLDSDVFVASSTPEEREKLESKASDASDWVYGEGADAPQKELKSRLKELKDLISPIERRVEESSKRPALVKALQDSLNQTNVWINTIKEQIREAEEFASSLSASATSSTEAAPSVTEAPSEGADEFDGLEDEQTTTKSTTTAVEDHGPAPPLYTLEDMKELTELYDTIVSWLEAKIAEQDKLPETADPVLLVKEIAEKTKKLEQAGVDLAMRSVKKFESKFKKNSSSKKSSRTKTKSKTGTKTGTAGDSEPTLDFNFGENGEMPSGEELEEIIKKMTEEQKKKDQAKKIHDEL